MSPGTADVFEVPGQIGRTFRGDDVKAVRVIHDVGLGSEVRIDLHSGETIVASYHRPENANWYAGHLCRMIGHWIA